jgi:hypothetical protein
MIWRSKSVRGRMKSDGEEKTKKKERMSQPKRSERMVKSEMSGERKSCDTGGVATHTATVAGAEKYRSTTL